VYIFQNLRFKFLSLAIIRANNNTNCEDYYDDGHDDDDGNVAHMTITRQRISVHVPAESC
jgi:hypothetical protein